MNLKRLWLRDHTRQHRVALDSVELWAHVLDRRRPNVKRKNQPCENGVKLTVGEMIARAASCTGPVGEVLCSTADFRDTDKSIRHEVHWRLEMRRIVVGCPHVLYQGRQRSLPGRMD